MASPGKGRLNFVLPEAVDTKLQGYCERTNRPPADVIRQLVSEWIEGDRSLPTIAKKHPQGRRTNIPLNYTTLAALDKRVRDEGHATMSAVVAALLGVFLAHRHTDRGSVPITIQMPVRIFDQVTEVCRHRGVAIEQMLLDQAQAFVLAERMAKGRS